MIITAGSTSVSLPTYFVDDDGGTAPGEPTTGLLFSDIETGGSASYQRQGAARVDLTLITLASASAAYASGGFILVDDTNMPGTYRVDYPDAAFATGVDFVIIQMVAASGKNTVMRPLLIDLTDVDLRDSVRGGMTALPNAAADAAGGLATSVGGATGIDDLATPTNITAGTITTTTNLTNLPSIPVNWLTAAGIAASALNGKGDWNIGKTGYSLTQTFPTNFADLSITVTTGLVTLAGVTHTGAVIPTVTTLTGHTAQTGDSFTRLGAPAGASIAADLLVIDNFVDGIETAVITNAAGVDIAADIIALKAETALIVGDTGELQTDWVNGGRLDLILDARMAEASISTTGGAVDTVTTVTNEVTADITKISGSAIAADNLEAHALETLAVTFTTAGGSTTAAVLNNVNGAAASTTNDVYIGRILVFNNSTLDHQITEITAYVGATKTATITAVTTAPTSSHTARMV